MNTIKLLTASLFALAVISCASHRSDPYDTGNVFGYPDASYMDTSAGSNKSLYDTPSAYDDSDSTPDLSPAEPAASGSYYRTHTVVRGDTLSGISGKYNIKMAAIKSANNMKNNIVVLGRKLIIPSR